MIILEIWSKTLLISYRLLGLAVDRIDSLVKKISINSMFYNKKASSSTMSQIERLIEFNDKKVNLTNLKVLTEECMETLSAKELEVVSLLYIDGLAIEEVAQTLGVSIRTVFRRKKKAIESFSRALNNKTSRKYLLENYTEEQWLMDIYNYNASKSGEDVILTEDDNCVSVDSMFKAMKELNASI